MSRNLMRTDCYFCESEVKLTERPRLLTRDDAGEYFEEYFGMTVANAECVRCKAQYLAWVIDSPAFCRRHGSAVRFVEAERGELGHFDLSFRSTFDDEPGPDDMGWFSRLRHDRIHIVAPLGSRMTMAEVNAQMRGGVGLREPTEKEKAQAEADGHVLLAVVVAPWLGSSGTSSVGISHPKKERL